MKLSKIWAAASALALSAVLLQADSLRMKDGSVVNGVFEGADRNDIRFRVAGRDQVRHYNVYDVDSLRFDQNITGYNNSPSNGNYRTEADRARSGDAYPNAPGGGPNGAFVLPAGTILEVRTLDSIDSDSSRVGETYRATLTRDLTINGQTVAPRGSDAQLQVVQLRQGGRISGREEIALALSALNINGRMYNLSTNSETVSSGSRGRQSAEVIGGGATLGAIIGAIAGGGEGAAIGAASGAAVGTGAQVLRGQRVRVPAESRLSFTLTNDMPLSY